VLPSAILPTAGVLVGVGVVLLLQLLLSAPSPPDVLLAAAVALGYAVLLLWPRQLTVGEDGLLLSWLWRQRFIPYEAIARVETGDLWLGKCPGIGLVFQNGRHMDITTSVFVTNWAERDALLSLIRAAVEDHEARRRRRREEMPEILSRGARSHQEWARALLSAGSGANLDPRTAPAPMERLLEVATSSEGPLSARIAAIAALDAGPDEEVKARVRVAVQNTVAPEAREALLGAVEAGEDEEALAELLAYAERRGARRH
jgi:hypothetical protein